LKATLGKIDPRRFSEETMEMRLWLVKRRGHTDYDQHEGFLVRASSEIAARFIVAETVDPKHEPYHASERAVWLGNVGSECVELTHGGPEGVLLESFRAG
jgi:hypothetical protein